MALFNKINHALTRYADDQRGAFSMMWAIGGAVLIGLMGAAVDFAIYYNTEGRAQTVADTVALAAAIYVRDNGEIPTNRDEGLLGDYTSGELGYEFRDWVIDGSDGVSISVVYDTVNKQVTVNTEGSTQPFFMQVFGRTHLDFGAQSVAKFLETQPLDPASVVLVLDNSGSMFFDDNPIDADGNTPDGTQRRIDGLISSANNFMDLLDEQVGDQDGSTDLPRVLRTGMMAFSGDIIPARTVSMNWGTIAESAISSMVPGGATNSAPPLTMADTWLTINEPPVHEAENPGKTPLKYLILMTDGRNTVGTEEWVQRDGTENWRRFVTGRPTSAGLTGERPSDPPTSSTVQTAPETCSTNPIDRWTWQCHFSFSNGANLSRIYGPYSSDPGNQSGSFNHATGPVTYNCNSRQSSEEVCTPAQFETTWSGYEYFEGETPPDGTWEEGEPDITSNIETRAQCDSLHQDGVEVFSIAYALAEGDYRTNDWGIQNRNGNPDATIPTTADNANDARAILQYCASSASNFITADNTEALEEAFERIGNAIVKEIIRIDS